MEYCLFTKMSVDFLPFDDDSAESTPTTGLDALVSTLLWVLSRELDVDQRFVDEIHGRSRWHRYTSRKRAS